MNALMCGGLRPLDAPFPVTPTAHWLRAALMACALGTTGASAQPTAQPAATATATEAPQPPTTPASRATPATQRVQPGERLSDWMLRQPPGGFPEGLVWAVPEEKAAQNQLKRGLQQTGLLSDWLQAQKVTGRAILARPDARWLQAHPDQDPVLREGDTVRMAPRPRTVAVLLDTGETCHVPHTPGAVARQYVAACTDVNQVPWAWVVQPDGQQARVGVQGWNAGEQDELAPGARVWAPSRQTGIDPAFSDALARFMGTLGPEASPEANAAGMRWVMAPAPGTPDAPVARTTRNATLSASDWGSVGLLQTPTARMAEAGAMRFHISKVQPYTHLNVIFQPLDFLEAGFRYTSISNRIYGVSNRDYTDKSLDVKLRLAQESTYLPQLAVGVRDLGGTGLFAGEYLVANKRWHDLDFSAGLGWGYVGGRGLWANPLGALYSGFKDRPVDSFGEGGKVSTKTFFRGNVAPFGGVQWHTPIDALTLKLEIDGNDYQREPLGNVFRQRTPLNVGAVYQYSEGIAFSAGLERGNKVMLGLTLASDLARLQTPKLSDPALPRLNVAAPMGLPATGWERTAQDLALQTGWTVQSMAQQGDKLEVHIDQSDGAYRQERIERMVPVLHRDAPASVKRFVLRFSQRGMTLSAQFIDRQAWVVSQSQGHAPSTRPQPYTDAPPPLFTPEAIDEARGWVRNAPRGSVGLNPYFSQVLGGPDAFLLYQLGVSAVGEYRFSDSTWATGIANLRALDNFDKFQYTAPSNLPRVRTFAREFVTTSRLTLPVLQVTHAERLGQDHFVSLYGGLLESMYAGVGAEWLYRPWRSPVALGFDINHVRQRDFHQDFRLRDYSVNTGHATLYWDTGISGLQTKLMAGQYLAGDRGVTVDVSRRFNNGVVLGAYATKTNVSAAQFGEGSFDKGIYVSIPYDAMLTRSSTETATIAWQPLTRDGGARLNRRYTLFDLTSLRDNRALALRTPSGPLARYATGAALFSTDTPDGSRPDVSFQDLGRSAWTLGSQLTDASHHSGWWWAGGSVLAAALLDRPLDRLASQHPTGVAKTFGNAGTALPLLFAAGASLAVTGLAGEDEARTGWTAIKAATATLALNTGVRLAVGRSRPEDEQGPTHFEPFKGGGRSSFTSNHTSLAFALVTPFAQRYDMPWLYGLAATTGLARVQQRKHWLTDVVAGGAMGYAVGSLMLEQQLNRRNLPTLQLGINSVNASWQFE